jgi:lysozyme
MTLSPLGLDLIKRFEGLRLDAYLCPAGVWTIGYGHTDGVQPGMRITAAGAEEFLASDVATVETGLAAVVRVPLTQGQWDALVSLSFNLAGGPAGLPRVCPRLVACLRSGDYRGAAAEFLDVDRDTAGQVLPGLARRRLAESRMFLGE